MVKGAFWSYAELPANSKLSINRIKCLINILFVKGRHRGLLSALLIWQRFYVRFLSRNNTSYLFIYCGRHGIGLFLSYWLETSPINLAPSVFGLWVESGAPRGNPYRHSENMKTTERGDQTQDLFAVRGLTCHRATQNENE